MHVQSLPLLCRRTQSTGEEGIWLWEGSVHIVQFTFVFPEKAGGSAEEEMQGGTGSRDVGVWVPWPWAAAPPKV